VKIFDTSGLLHSNDMNFYGFITPLVFKEVIDENIKAVVKLALRNKSLVIISPSEESIKTVKNKVAETKDRLSETDIEVLACAFERGLIVVSDDYSIQNVAKFLGVDYEVVAQDGIQKKVVWKNVCTGCGKEYETHEKICGVCGSALKIKYLLK